MTETKNAECIRTHENHEVRIANCETDIKTREKDINKLGSSLRDEMKNLWSKLDRYIYVIIGTGVFQVITVVVAIYLKK